MITVAWTALCSTSTYVYWHDIQAGTESKPNKISYVLSNTVSVQSFWLKLTTTRPHPVLLFTPVEVHGPIYTVASLARCSEIHCIWQ